MDVINKINKAKHIGEILPYLTIKDLEDAIKTASDSYYNTGISLLTDTNFDLLIEKLRKLDPNSSIFKQTGAPIRGKKNELPFFLGSMDKIKSDEKPLKKWLLTYKGPFLLSDKLDGVSCLLTITNGKISLFTRGDGNYGQNISHLLPLINASADKLPTQSKTIAIRGELIMSIENFEKYAKIMSNARNMVSGIVNSKPESVNKKHARDVDFVVYEIIEPTMKPSDQMVKLKKLGMNVVYHDSYDDIDLSILDAVLQKRKKKSIYEIDGIIVTDDNDHPRNKSGNPTYSFAYKGLTETADVKVIEVLWKASKDGILVPRIHYEKTRISQADLEFTHGFNAKFIVDHKIGPGSIITIIRSGEVIPYLLQVIKPSKRPSLPKNVAYHWDKNHVNIILDDANEDRTVIIRRLTKFMHDIGVENLSEGIVTRLVDNGFDTIPKVIVMTVDDFLSMEGFQKTLANKLYDNLQTALGKLDILTLMVASNVFGRGFGERKIKKILNVYPKIVVEYTKATNAQWKQKLMSLDGFDTISVDAFLDCLPDFQIFYRIIKKIIDIKPYKPLIKKAGSFANQTIVFTGFRNKPWQIIVENEGGKMSGSVSKNTTLLVYNDGEESSSKYLKAKQLGVKTIRKSEFAKKYKL